MKPRSYPTAWEMLEALKGALQDLERVRTIPEDDPTLLKLKQTLRQRIAAIENAQLVVAN